MIQYISNKPLQMQKYLAEFLGSLFFIYVILATGNPLAIGAALALVILLTQQISGGYANPAVSIAMAAAGTISTSELIPYCLSQIMGGLVALELYKRFRM
jgi:aquaporin Z